MRGLLRCTAWCSWLQRLRAVTWRASGTRAAVVTGAGTAAPAAPSRAGAVAAADSSACGAVAGCSVSTRAAVATAAAVTTRVAAPALRSLRLLPVAKVRCTMAVAMVAVATAAASRVVATVAASLACVAVVGCSASTRAVAAMAVATVVAGKSTPNRTRTGALRLPFLFCDGKTPADPCNTLSLGGRGIILACGESDSNQERRMGVPFVRPRVADVVFRLYDRPLHPELFDVVATKSVVRDGRRLTVRLTRTGHTLAWSGTGTHLEEVTATADQDLPEAGVRLIHRFDGGRRGRCELPGVKYQMALQLEVLEPEQFVHLHAELVADGQRKGLVYHCKTSNRIGLSPLGVVIVEALPQCLSVTAFHTFPDEFAILKTQSLIEQI